MENTKQIKDLTLQTGVDGNEDILIQNNGVTKRIKSGEFLTEHQDISHLATKTSVSNLESEVSDLKKSVSDGKTLIASAITDKGVNTSNTDTFQVMADNIARITSVGGAVLVYTTDNEVEGNASGVISMNIAEEETGSYTIKWGNENGALSEYEEITTFEFVTPNSIKAYEFTHHNAIPENATKIIAIKDGKVASTVDIPENKIISDTKRFCFGALSDIHLDGDGTDDSLSASDLSKFIRYFEENNAVAICNSGDITNDGHDYDVEALLSIMATTDIPFYTARGNHDNAQECSGLDNDLYLSIEPNGNLFMKTINDEIFIFCGIVSSSAGLSSIFTQNQISELATLLETYKNKRVFLFEHVFVGGTGNIYGLYDGVGMNTGGNAGVFRKLMATYRNVILFTGHSHLDFNLQRLGEHANAAVRSDDLCHRVHIPSASKPRRNDESTEDISDNTYKYNAGGLGYLVDVYDDFIILKGVDIIKDKILPYATYRIDTNPIIYEDNFNTEDSLVFYVDGSNPENTETLAKDLSGNGNDFEMSAVTLNAGYFGFSYTTKSYMRNTSLTLSSDTTPKSYTFEWVMNCGIGAAGEGYIFSAGDNTINWRLRTDMDEATGIHELEVYSPFNGLKYEINTPDVFDAEHHYVYTLDGKTGLTSLYQDGVYIGGVVDADIKKTLNAPMVIGQRYDANSGDGSFTGTMKYVKLYSRCFNTTEVINAYNNYVNTEDGYTSNFVNFGKETSTVNGLTVTFDNTLITYNGSPTATLNFLDPCTYVNVSGDFKANTTYYVQLIHKGGSVDTTNRPEILDVSVSIDNGATYVIEKDERTLDDIYERIEFEVTNDCNSLLLVIRPKGKMIFNNYAISAVIGEA